MELVKPDRILPILQKRLATPLVFFYCDKGERMNKVIHCVWLGHGEMSDKIKACMNSWREVMPDWTIKVWNEDNFDINYNKFTRQSYDAKKYAFTSDVIRLYALYTEGGIYLDTDVMMYKPLDEFTKEKAFTGFECSRISGMCNDGSGKG